MILNKLLGLLVPIRADIGEQVDVGPEKLDPGRLQNLVQSLFFVIAGNYDLALVVHFEGEWLSNLEVMLEDEILVLRNGLLFADAACGEDS